MDDFAVSRIPTQPPKGIFKGEDDFDKRLSAVAGTEFENVILGMKQMLDKDLVLKA